MRECLNSFTNHLLTFVCALALPSPQTYVDKFPPGGLVIRPNDSGHPLNSVWPFGHWGWRVWFCCETILKCSFMLGKEVASRDKSSRSSIVLCGLTKKKRIWKGIFCGQILHQAGSIFGRTAASGKWRLEIHERRRKGAKVLRCSIRKYYELVLIAMGH